VLYFSASDEVYALNASDGSVFWSHQIGAYSSPAVGTYKTLLGTSHHLTALSTQTGALGKRYLVGIINTPLVIYKHVLYFTTYDTAKLYAFDFQTWTPIWVDTIARETESAPTLA
jgi:outer membrane protein assembly factor BamB